MTDEEVLCSFMEPRPYTRTRSRDSDGGWWRLVGYDRKAGEWIPNPSGISLDKCREIEAKLTDKQLNHYDREIYAAMQKTKPRRRVWFAWNAKASKKIKALAAVLRGGNHE